MPTLIGGRTTPGGRAEVGGGAAVRVPLAALAPSSDAASQSEAFAAFAQPGGVAPVEFARWGIDSDWAVGALVSGSMVRLDGLGAARLGPMIRLIGGVSPYLGYAYTDTRGETPRGEGLRGGAIAPLAIAVDVSGVMEGWLGARVGIEHIEGTLSVPALSGHSTGVRGGLFLGFGVGFRNLHALIELGADYEGHWGATRLEGAFMISGFALTPAFVLRYRI